MAETERRCAKCKHWMPGKTDEAMRVHRMAVCRFLPAWTYLPPQGECRRHAPATPKAIAARMEWLKD